MKKVINALGIILGIILSILFWGLIVKLLLPPVCLAFYAFFVTLTFIAVIIVTIFYPIINLLDKTFKRILER